MTITSARQFRIGDKVRVRGKVAGPPWTVSGDDTNCTPVHDLEPAYKLMRPGERRPYPNVRYAYESELIRTA